MGWVSPSIPEDISKLLTSPSLPGQESGNGLVDILYGSTSPGGKLPYTIAKREADYGTAVVSGNDDYPEGLYIDYRHFDKEGIAPRYEFGFGLSYTTFNATGISGAASVDSITSEPEDLPIVPGGNPALWETVYTVNATVSNSGDVAGHAVPQL